VSELTPEIVDNCRSIGAATDAAMVSALAPGNCAVITMVGNSTAGSAATPSARYPKIPNTMNVAVSRVVSTGRRIQSSDKFMFKTPF
jgi:sugar/nucleoside kinase (ribokinase family)